jgi:hypothetical protein
MLDHARDRATREYLIALLRRLDGNVTQAPSTPASSARACTGYSSAMASSQKTSRYGRDSTVTASVTLCITTGSGKLRACTAQASLLAESASLAIIGEAGVVSVTAALGWAFLAVGLVAMFLMLHLWRYPFDKVTRVSAAPRWAMWLHRGLGYVFVAFYVALMWHMLPAPLAIPGRVSGANRGPYCARLRHRLPSTSQDFDPALLSTFRRMDCPSLA